MIPLSPPFRLATADDGPALAQLVNYAGDGLPLHLWRGLAAPGQDPWALGAARQAERAAEGKVVAVDRGAGVIAAMTGYAIGPAPEPLDTLPPLFVPLQALENLALESWYVNVLAVMPAHRGQGLGAGLLALAERIAAAQGLRRLSIITADDNAGALRLYRRTGYAEVARRAMVKDGWATGGADWVLLVKRLPEQRNGTGA